MDIRELPPDDGVLVLVMPEDLEPSLSDTELVADIWAADSRAARYAAERAAAIAAFARRRHIQRDAAFGRRGGPGHDSRLRRHQALAEVSETFVPELALLRNCSEAEAETLAVESILLTTKLRRTWSALYDGRVDVPKARALIDLLGPVKLSVAEQVEQLVLPAADKLTVPLLRQRVRRLLAKLDADALDKRREEAARRADVVHQPTGDGMGQVVIDLPLPTSAACVDAIDQYAQMLRADGDERPIGVIRAAVAADLILRPWDTGRPSVTAKLVVHAPLPALRDDADGPQPAAEIAGEVVTAAQCRELLEQLGILGVGDAPAGGSVHLAISDPSTGRLRALASRRELDRGARGAGVCTPRAAPGYEPTSQQRRFVEVRDRHCRMPGCRRRPGRLDIDHAVAHADGGATDCRNLCCLCRRHHRIKTFAPSWDFELLDDGRLIVRTPSGVSRTTDPPGWWLGAEPEPPWLDETAPPDPMRC
ncbi:HNH endonuclease [Blastococcus sp. TBT05-19]|uniref:HNH endonuclease signature motif containing protein n=1 Tax=Blastococcus sp. TBT05-19 TaxID=2250581 RepID=UPI000DEB64D7|nr:HNH endonuclease signature motif containing protein [Blastococcus sp. TBT05-19]RBY88119.1 HNH endonuclease [Blastococcus sp. TBT05-19]